MPPVLRTFGAASGLAVVIEARTPLRRAGRPRHRTRPLHPQGRPLLQAAANVLADAIERHAADQALRHRVLHDALTGLPNRLSFVDALDRRAEAGDRLRLAVGILFLDLDHFKLINDSLGHNAGDALLRAVAPRLRGTCGPATSSPASAATSSAILIDRLADEEEAIAIADRVSAAFARPFSIEGAEHFVSASVGDRHRRAAEQRAPTPSC